MALKSQLATTQCMRQQEGLDYWRPGSVRVQKQEQKENFEK